MTDSSDAPTPPDGLPDGLATELHGLTVEELRNVVVHARELLQHRREPGSPIGPGLPARTLPLSRQGERPEGGTHHHWTFLGEVRIDD